MSSASKSLMAQVTYNNQKLSAAEVWTMLNALPPDIPLTTSEAAIFLRESVTSMERMRKDGSGPVYSQSGGANAKGTNQKCLYDKSDLLAWKESNKVTSSLQAAIRKGQAFATIFDLAQHEAFYLDAKGNVESMVEENLLGTVLERLGKWNIIWMTPIEAASRRWTDLGKHQEFAAGVQSVLSNALHGVQCGIDATDIALVTAEAPVHAQKLID